MKNTFVAPIEIKFADDTAGEFSGYGAVFGNVDSHGDMIVPGAFAASLAQHKSLGRMPVMYAQHGAALGGDPLPVGVWTKMEEDARGLRVEGRISALDTDYGRRIRALVKDGALGQMSIGYRVPSNGAAYGKKPGEAKRTLKTIDVFEVSLVAAASNHLANVDSIKSALAAGGTPTLREIEEALREQLGLSRSQAAAFAAGGYKSLIARESGDGEAMSSGALKAIADLRRSLDGFTLTT